MCTPADINLILNEIKNLKVTLEYFGEVMDKSKKTEEWNAALIIENKALKERLAQYERDVAW